MSHSQADLDKIKEGLLRGDSTALGRAITLIESSKHQERAQKLLSSILPYTGKSIRVGITGVPGVGKSTFIEQLGQNLIASSHRVAVLAIDPTSSISGGSILGDKTRMVKLASMKDAFIRPSPTSGTLGGVAQKSRESLLLCEAAGYDIVLVETVGIGQSEFRVAQMVDFCILLLFPGVGDQLQGIKRGVMELADLVAINQADGQNSATANRTRQAYEEAMHFLRPKNETWTAPVLTCSSTENCGLDAIWDEVENHRELMSNEKDKGKNLQSLRQKQLLDWLWHLVEEELGDALKKDPRVQKKRKGLEKAVLNHETTPYLAAQEVIATFLK